VVRVKYVHVLMTITTIVVTVTGASCNKAKKSDPVSVTEATQTTQPIADPQSSESQSSESQSSDSQSSDSQSSDPLADGVDSAGGTVVRVAFDNPGADPRPIKETDVPITARSKRLALEVTDLAYRGVVCGFTFKGATRPTSPVEIRMIGTKGNGEKFDSGPVDVSWLPDATTATTSTSEDNGWAFSADATPNRNGPGWVISLGGVTADSPDAIPKAVRCELTSTTEFPVESGPVGYWAGFATQ
jgi:hypothetical protein